MTFLIRHAGICTVVVAALIATLDPMPAAAQFGEPPRATVSSALSYDALQARQQAVIAVVLDVATGFHAQSHTPHGDGFIRTEVQLEENPDLQVFEAIYPPGKDETYPELGTLNVYSGRAIIYVPVEVKADAAPGPMTITGELTYQICDDKVCYAPETTPFTIQTQVVPAGQPVEANRSELFAGFDPSVFSKLIPVTPGTGRSSDAGLSILGHKVGKDSYVLAFVAALLVGVIFNVMPCVLPVLPLKALGFYEVSQHRRGKAFALGLVFSFGIVGSFAVLALLILFQGQNWGELFSRGWFVWGMTLVLVLFAMSTWGLFTFRLPLGVYSFEPRHDTYSGNFLFGALTALLSTPCTAPIFPALLLWASAQPKAMGMGVIMMVGVGMALPYLVLSAMPELARRLPRTGPWSELVKQMMGFLILGVAAYFAGLRILPGNQYMWLVFVVAIAAGIFLVVRTLKILPRPVPIVVSVVVAIAFSGATFATARALNRPGLWTYFSMENFEQSRKTGQIVLIKFTAAWCANCQYVEQTVYHDEAALEAIRKHEVILIKADLTHSDAPGWGLLKELNPSGGIPLTAIYPPGSDQPIQLASIYTVSDLLAALQQAQSSPAAASAQSASERPSGDSRP